MEISFPAGETACPTYFAKRLIQQGGAGGFACRSKCHNQSLGIKMDPKTFKHPARAVTPVSQLFYYCFQPSSVSAPNSAKSPVYPVIEELLIRPAADDSHAGPTAGGRNLNHMIQR